MRGIANDPGVIYEVDLDVDARIAGPFDTWLRDHIADLLQLEGFQSAEILAPESDSPDRVRRTVHYRLRDQVALDAYLRDHAPRMRAQGIERFGDRYTARRRVLQHREEFIRGAVSTENCLNCGEVLTGQHCSHCGQRAKVRVLSLWGMLKELLGDLTDYDSRVWRTLRPLAFRPGKLTVDYLRGKRASYTPPFRLYLILSLAFFLAASLGELAREGFEVNMDESGTNIQLRTGEDEKPASAVPPQLPAAPATPKLAKPLDPETQKLVELFVSRVPATERARLRRELEAELGRARPEDLEKLRAVAKDPCSEENFKVELGPLTDRYAPPLREACRKIAADTGGFGRALYENIPKMMFIFLPLIAAVMYILYLGSGRYYVEHLLFFVHFHAFFFLGGIAILLLSWVETHTAGTVNKAAGFVEGLVTMAFVVYVPIYLFRAMQRVYGQGWFWTLAKYSALGIAYLFCMVLTGVGLLAYTALTL
jgi:hypothetical protein